MTKDLFNEAIYDWDSWERIRKSKESFMPLLKHIYEINNIKLENTDFVKFGFSGGLVFRADDTVIKIFIPHEIKAPYSVDYKTELAAMKFCKSVGVLTPDIICNGTIDDNRHSFPYIVMSYIDGIRVDKYINGDSEKGIECKLKLKEIADKIHIPTDINIPRYDNHLSKEALWKIMPESFIEDRKQYLSKIKFSDLVFQHGDLWFHNIIMDKQGRFYLIDFEDGIIAPSYFEWRGRSDDDFIMEMYFKGYEKDELDDIFTLTFLMDWRSTFAIKWRAEKTGIALVNITSIKALKDYKIV